MKHNRSIGALGEQYAADYLLSHGYTIRARNVYYHWGELDIVAEKDNAIVFVEVKTRIGDEKGKPWEQMTRRKINHLHRSMLMYIKKHSSLEKFHRLDVVSIVLHSDRSVKELKHFESITS
ncbi:YraN family protein [Candidatus Woesebacteria bacterium]|nr:YraN family protein [Candidatus Woesebacteria bacterium]